MSLSQMNQSRKIYKPGASDHKLTERKGRIAHQTLLASCLVLSSDDPDAAEGFPNSARTISNVG